MLKNSIIRFSTAVVLLMFFACSKSEKKQIQEISGTENLANFVSNSKIIRDSIRKLKLGNWDLIICTQKKTKDYTTIKFTGICDVFYIQHEYYYKSIDNANIIFYDYQKPLINKEIQSGLERFIRKKTVKIQKSDMLCCIMPSYYFAYCNEDPKIMSCFDFKMVGEREMQIITGKRNDISLGDIESSFYPKCK